MKARIDHEIEMGKPKQKLTLKQKSWLKYFFQTMNATEAARRAGYRCKNPDSFEAIGYENFRKLQPLIAQWISDVGLTPEKIKLKIIQGLEAKETQRMKIRGAVKPEALQEGRRLVVTSGTLANDKEGNNVFGDGDSVIEWDDEALGIQQRYVDLACKVLSLYNEDLIQRVERLEKIIEEGS